MNGEGLAASVRQRLQLIAKESKRDYNSVLLQYIQERFLYRLSKSTYKNAFILKGALLFVAFNIPTLRPTKDIDFLGNKITNNLDALEDIIKEICSINYDDAVNFEEDSIEANVITENKEYHGARVKIIAKLGTARTTLWLDFGFGDKIVTGPVDLSFPSLLNFESPIIKVYSLESAIAEKFQACVKLNFVTSRMKDFYDIHELASQNSFNLAALSEAVKETFSVRRTNIIEKSIIFSHEFKNDKNKDIQWKAFLKRTSLTSEFTFRDIVDRIEKFLNLAFEEKPQKKKCDKNLWRWK